MAEIPVGTKIEKKLLVDNEVSIDFLGLEGARVLATPWMIGWMERTCRDAVLPLLEPGHDTVGTHVDVYHLASTPMGTPAGQLLGRFERAGKVGGDIRLGQHNHRGGAALPGEHHQALEPAWSESSFQRADDEHLVDVRREHLWLVGPVRARTNDRAPPREHAYDRAAFEATPVANCRAARGRPRGQSPSTTSARCSPFSVRTLRAPRWTHGTRPGTAPSRWRSSNTHTKGGPQPASTRFVVSCPGSAGSKETAPERWEGGRAGESSPAGKRRGLCQQNAPLMERSAEAGLG